MEVILLNLTVFQGVFTVQGRRESINEGTLYLSFDLLRVHGNTTVRGRHDAVHVEVTALVNSDFGTGRNVAAK